MRNTVYSEKGGTGVYKKSVPEKLLNDILIKVEKKYDTHFPFKIRGIVISEHLIAATLEILNDEKTKTLPQNARHDNSRNTPDGLDKRLKIRMRSDTCRGHIVSDILSDIGVVNIYKIKNFKTGKLLNATQLIPEYSWG